MLGGQLAVLVHCHDAIRLIVRAVVEEDGVADGRNCGTEIVERSWKARVEFVVRDVVAAGPHPLRDTGDGQHRAVQADEDKDDHESGCARVPEESELGSDLVRQNRFRGKGDTRFDERRAQSLRFIESSTVNVVFAGGRRGPKRSGETISVDVREAERLQVFGEERRLTSPVGARENDEERLRVGGHPA
jgi:hypothetical protein